MEDLGEVWKMAIYLVVTQSWLGANAALEETQDRSGPVTLVWQEMEVKEGSWGDSFPKMRRRKGGQDKTQIQKEARGMTCTLLTGSAWSTEKKYMRRYRGTFYIFFGVEHRMRKEEMEEQFNKEDKQGWRFAADAARITDEKASTEDRKHTSGGVFVALDSNLGAVVGAKEGAVESFPGNEARIAQAWINVRGGMRVFSIYFWHSEGWTPRNEALLEAVVKQAKAARHLG